MKRAPSTPIGESTGHVGKRRSSRGSRLAAAAGSPLPDAPPLASPSSSKRATRSKSRPAHGPAKTAPSTVAAASSATIVPTDAVGQTKGGASAKDSRRSGNSSRWRSTRASLSSTHATAAGKAVTEKASSATSLRDSTASKASKKGAARIPARVVAATSSDGGGDGRGLEAATANGEATILATLIALGSPSKQDATHAVHEAELSLPETSAPERGGDTSQCPLEAMFLGLEQVLSLFRRRKQATLLKQVRGAVEGMCGRSFTRRHLAQIVFVQPDAYKLSSKTDARPTRSGYRFRDIMIEVGPGAVEEGKGASGSGHAGRQRDRAAGRRGGGDRRGSGDATDRSCAGGAVSLRRREIFRKLLMAARARHCKCGSGAEETGSAGECCCLPQASLPDTSPLAVDGIGRSNGSEDSQLGGKGADHRSAGGGDLLGAGGAGLGDGGDGEYNAPKDVKALRERLRQKDALSLMERNKSVEEKEADRRRKANLPAVADAVRSFFAHARGTTCPLDALVDALSASSRHALSTKEAKERIRMLADIVPEWCSIIAPPVISGGGRGGGAGAGVDEGMMAARRSRAKEVVRVNKGIRYGEVREMIVFMASSCSGGGGGGGGGGSIQ